MTETPQKRPLFRPEAVEHHLRGRATARQLDLRERRTSWVFRGVLVALGIALLVAATVRVDNVLTVPAEVDADGRTVEVELSRTPDEVLVSVAAKGREVGTEVELDGKKVTMTLDEPLPPDTVVRVTIDRGQASVLYLLLGWD